VKALPALLLSCLLAASCAADRRSRMPSDESGGEGEGEPPTEGEGEGEGEGSAEGEGEPDVSPDAGPGEDDGGGPAVEDAGPLPPCPEEGDRLGLGVECRRDCECAGGLCWLAEAVGYCTAPCETTHGCDRGLACDLVAPGAWGCVPPPAPPPTCSGHGDCPFPLACLQDADSGSWLCTWPPCRFAADCDEGKVCDPARRRCRTPRCAGPDDCLRPGELCDAESGECGPPECSTTSDCPPDEACVHPGRCRPASRCEADDGCPYYNEHCVDGFCVPDPCAASGCEAQGLLCDRDSGRCGPPCAGGCPAGTLCAPSGEACVEDRLPVAVVEARPGERNDERVLDAGGSYDPEGGPLSFAWSVLAAPPGSSHAPGPLAGRGGVMTTVRLDGRGTWRFGLHVTDAGGNVGIPAGVSLFR